MSKEASLINNDHAWIMPYSNNGYLLFPRHGQRKLTEEEMSILLSVYSALIDEGDKVI